MQENERFARGSLLLSKRRGDLTPCRFCCIRQRAPYLLWSATGHFIGYVDFFFIPLLHARRNLIGQEAPNQICFASHHTHVALHGAWLGHSIKITEYCEIDLFIYNIFMYKM